MTSKNPNHGWTHIGQRRPPFATEPGPGEESVWDYPRPPALVPDARRVQVWLGSVCVADTVRALRVLETAHPPTFYLPLADVNAQALRPAAGSSWCEWKGQAQYWSVQAEGLSLQRIGWSYPQPLPAFQALRDHLAFYAGATPDTLRCTVDGLTAQPQPGGFYGGWVTPDVVGPFKGEAGTMGW
jgi:uncharacterized protein (DUF427 family)